jgi:hypothetical protein
MENQIYRVELSDNNKLEFSICDSNTTSNPPVPIKIIGVCVYSKISQLDGGLDIDEVESLISYLEGCVIHMRRNGEREVGV